MNGRRIVLRHHGEAYAQVYAVWAEELEPQPWWGGPGSFQTQHLYGASLDPPHDGLLPDVPEGMAHWDGQRWRVEVVHGYRNQEDLMLDWRVVGAPGLFGSGG